MGPLTSELTEMVGVSEQAMINAAATLNMNGADPAEPCGLTMAEWQAHQATMIADADHAKKQKMMHLALAAGAGFLLSRFISR